MPTEVATTEKRAPLLETQNGNGHAPVSILEVIERASLNPAVDVDKMRALLEMHEHVLNRDAEVAFTRAMTAAQSDIKAVFANETNPQTRSKYATYEQVDKALRPVYIKHGFALSFGTDDSPSPDSVRVVCDVSHSAGHSKRYKLDMPADGKGAKGGDVMTKTHAVGAGISYGKRYLVGMIFNLAFTETDTDGNAPVKTISEEQVKGLQALAKETKSSISKLLAYYKIDKIENLPISLYDSAVTAFKKHGAGATGKAKTDPPTGALATLYPAPAGQAIDKPTVKVITSKMELGALSIGDFKKRFGLSKLEEINCKDIPTVLAWIIDPQTA